MRTIKKLLAVCLAGIIAVSAYSQNLMTNGGFESGLDNWYTVAGEGTTADFTIETAEVSAGSGTLKVSVTTPGDDAWDVQAINDAWPSVADQTYTLTFAAKAAVAGQTMRLVMQNESYSAKDFALTTDYAEYSWTFTAAEAGLELAIHFPEAGTFYLDDFTIIDPGNGGTTPEIDLSNMIFNGDFEQQTKQWSALNLENSAIAIKAQTEDVASGTYSLKADVTTLGINNWDVQLIHAGWASKADNTYSLTFKAKAAVSGTKVTLVMQNESYAGKDFTLTDNYQEYTWQFTAAEDNLQLKIFFNELGTFYFDDFYIEDPDYDPNAVSTDTISVDLTDMQQEMIGFGGALTWYCDMITKSSQKETIYDLMFNDLGLDIIRYKNWYYPINYPTDKSSASMEVDWFGGHYTATLELFKQQKAYDPSIQTLLCSWSPPSYMKSNGDLNEGSLKKDGNRFMYSEYAEYWQDVLENHYAEGFLPDYVSIQNESGYTNTDWETCKWRPTETADFAGYDVAFDSVYNRVKNMSHIPKFIGPEVENIGNNSDIGENSFRGFTSPLKDNDNLFGYAYHVYNYSGANESKVLSATNNLNMIRDEFGEKPAFMTEFGGLDWLSTALMVHKNVVDANAVSYIYWELMWNNSETAMIDIPTENTYEINPCYYSMKHFSKYVDKGYIRVGTQNINEKVHISAYKKPDANKLTFVLINLAYDSTVVNLNLGDNTIVSSEAYQSVEGDFWQTTEIDQSSLVLKGRSITTVSIEYTSATVETQILELKKGWNLVSIYVDPSDKSVENVFSGVSVVKDLDSFYSESYEDFLNSITEIVPGNGYLVYVDADMEITIKGALAQLAAEPELSSGWNLIGSWSNSKTVENALSSQINNIEVVKSLQLSWFSTGGTSTLENLEPGKAYFVKVK